MFRNRQNNIKIRKKITYLNMITTVICAVVILTGTFLSYRNLKHIDVHYYSNNFRVKLSDTILQIEQGNYISSDYPYMVISLSGDVLYKDSENFKYIRNTVNVKDAIQTDFSFTSEHKGMFKEVFLLYQNQTLYGFGIFLVPETELFKSPVKVQIITGLYPLFLSLILVLVIMIIEMFLYQKKIFTPLIEISKSAKYIIGGNYDYEVLRVNSTKVREDEIGDLVYSFELMRDELKDKQIREERLKKSQQELISCISHDLKTPISTIKAYGEGLRDGIAKTPELEREYEEVIIKKTNLLNQMITELLEYSNAQLNQLDMKPKEQYFYPYFQSVMKELIIYGKQRNVTISYELHAADRIVTIDEKRVTEVLYNLVENSMKYMGTVDGKINIIAQEQEEKLLIRVIDNGMGINADDIPYVFDKFYRAEKSRSSSIPGSGLGLSICKYIIETLGGNIYCKSGQKEGCEIGFTLV